MSSRKPRERSFYAALRQIERSAHGHRKQSGDTLSVVFLHLGNRLVDRFRHDSVDRATIVAAAAQNGLQRAHIRRVVEQFSSRLEVVVHPPAFPVSVVYLTQNRGLVEDSPFIPRRQRIGGVEKRIFQRASGSHGQHNQRENEKATEWSHIRFGEMMAAAINHVLFARASAKEGYLNHPSGLLRRRAWKNVCRRLAHSSLKMSDIISH